MGAARLPPQRKEDGCSMAVSLEMQQAPCTSDSQGASDSQSADSVTPDHVYLVSMKWWNALQTFVAQRSPNSGDDSDVPSPGPIDNSPLIISDCVKERDEPILKPDLKEGIDYKVVTGEDWDRLQNIHGKGLAIRKPVLKEHSGFGPVAEVYKMSVTVIADSGADRKQQRADLSLSAETTLGELKDIACKELNLNGDNVKVWDYYQQMKYSPLDDCMDKTLQDCRIMEGQEILLESTSSTEAVGSLDSSSSEANVGSPVSDVANSLAPMSIDTPILLPPPSTCYPSLNSTSYFSDTITPSENVERGLAGLNNLGNTCFMNSSLQCLIHSSVVVSYFLSNKYREDINVDNPLGMNGELAESFGSLLHAIWKGNTLSVAPRGFKSKLAHFAPQFSGYSQQDSQELLAFLLDGLHEDLNRIKNKPYIEDKDSDGRPDEEVAAEAWYNYCQRNDSIVVDHFQGLYKSCLVCPTCNHSSVKFDPFMYLSLPLPTSEKRPVTVTVVCSDGSMPPTQYCLLLPKNGTIADLRAELGKTLNLGAHEETVLAEVSFHRIRAKLEDDQDIRSAVGVSSMIVAYRLRQPGEKFQEVHVLHRHSGKAVMGTLFAAPLLLWLPAMAEGEEDDSKLQEEIESQLHMALRPFAVRRQRANSASDRDSASDTGAGTSQDQLASDAVSHMSVDYSDEDGRHGIAGSSHNVDSSSAGVGGKPREPFDMWANSTQHPVTRSKSHLANRKRGTVPYQLRRCSEFGTVLSGSSSSYSFSKLDIKYFVLEWENDGGGLYDPNLLEDPRQDESMALALNQMDSTVSLDACLDCFLQHEMLDPEDSWYCPKCKEHVQADKKLDLWTLPEVLVVHLKRFSYSTRLREKLSAPIDYPLLGLDLSKYVLKDQDKPPVYDLFAVSNHMGGLGGGHYTAFAKQPGTEQWYCFDDSRVYSIAADQVVSPNGYVLFYQRRHEAEKRDEQVLEVLRDDVSN